MGLIPPKIFRNLAMCVNDIHSYYSAALAIHHLGQLAYILPYMVAVEFCHVRLGVYIIRISI